MAVAVEGGPLYEMEITIVVAVALVVMVQESAVKLVVEVMQ